MGCGASKVESQVMETTLPASKTNETASSKPVQSESQEGANVNADTNPTVTSPSQTGVSAAQAAAGASEDERATNPGVGNSGRPGSGQSRRKDDGAEAPVAQLERGASIVEKERAAPSAERVKKEEAPKAGSSLSRAVIPSIPFVSLADAAKGTHKAVAFEIPIDEELMQRRAAEELSRRESQTEMGIPLEGQRNAVKGSLPKLGLSEHDIRAKLANTEARWKDLEEKQAERRQHRRKGAKPTLSTNTKKTVDPETLKRRLQEKEAHASENRKREINKLQSKLARQDEHARKVQERKKALGRLSNEDLNLSWGGEDGLETLVLKGEEMKKKKGHKLDFDEIDSGKGSSAVSLSLGSRSGSGRSNATNGEIDAVPAPIPSQ
ncbi:hypothetical protein HDU97_010404 [Phlyctochytrium planicorne]|nr:hypothetical protein HDU97_010404 [Phlyctochytrium planicorne]